MKLFKAIGIMLILASGAANANIQESGYDFGDKVKIGDEKIKSSGFSYILNIEKNNPKHLERAIGSFTDESGLCQLSLGFKFQDQQDLLGYIKSMEATYGDAVTYEVAKTPDDYTLILWEPEKGNLASFEFRFKSSNLKQGRGLAQGRDIAKCQEIWYE